MGPLSLSSNVKRTPPWVRSAPSKSASGMRTVAKWVQSDVHLQSSSDAFAKSLVCIRLQLRGSDSVASPMASRTESLCALLDSQEKVQALESGDGGIGRCLTSGVLCSSRA